MESGYVPSDWLFKEDSRHLADNYRSILLTVVPCKILEHIGFLDVMARLDFNNILVNSQRAWLP